MPAWTTWVGMTVVCWGTYGLLLHTGAVAMGDPENGRLRAFLFVGIAYFLVAVLAPLVVLLAKGANLGDVTPAGAGWSLVAGIVGAIGALGVLLAFGAKGHPAVVMALVFGGAPIVNALASIAKDGTWGQVRWPFVLGILLAALGGGLVTWFKPSPAPHAPPPTETPRS